MQRRRARLVAMVDSWSSAQTRPIWSPGTPITRETSSCATGTPVCCRASAWPVMALRAIVPVTADPYPATAGTFCSNRAPRISIHGVTVRVDRDYTGGAHRARRQREQSLRAGVAGVYRHRNGLREWRFDRITQRYVGVRDAGDGD